MQPTFALVIGVTAKMSPAESPWVPRMGGTDAQGSPTSLFCHSPTAALLAAWGWRCLHCLHVHSELQSFWGRKEGGRYTWLGAEQTGAVCRPELMLQTWLHPFRCLLAPPGLLFPPALSMTAPGPSLCQAVAEGNGSPWRGGFTTATKC